MDLKSAFGRARRGLREDARLYVVAISSLTVAFLCLGAALLGTTNVSRLADHWGRSARMSVYLRDGAIPADVTQLRAVLEGLAEVASVQHLTAEGAREQFEQQTSVGADLSALPADVFPASLEITFRAGSATQRLAHIAERVRQFRAVEDIETYQGWFGRLDALVSGLRIAAFVTALLVLVCVLAVVSNTIRLAVVARREEVEVMKLCGATDPFVRSPFIVEGALQGFIAAFLAIVLLSIAFVAMQGRVDATIAALTGIQTRFLHPVVVLAFLVGGALTGALGSAVSLRRYLTV